MMPCFHVPHAYAEISTGVQLEPILELIQPDKRLSHAEQVSVNLEVMPISGSGAKA